MINKIKNFVSKKDYFSLLLCIFFFVIVIICCLLSLPNMVMILSIIASVLLLYNVQKNVGNCVSVSIFFTIFHILYGLSGPISVVWLNGLTSTYGSTYNIYPYMIAYSLASVFYNVGFYCSNKYCLNMKPVLEYRDISTKSSVEKDKYRKYFLFVAECGFILTLLFELINLIRVGGFPTVLRGKAIYQAAVDELKYTLPSSELSHVSVVSLCVYMFISLKENMKISKTALASLFVLISPYLLLLVFLGKRGNILSFIMIIVVTVFQYRPMKRLSRKFLMWVVVIYLVLSSMFAIRSYTGLMFKDFHQFIYKVVDKDNLISSFNPGQNEFGCTFGNFNKLYIANDYQFLYGSSYITGLTHFIPSYLFPGEKPQLLMYQFRDKYFPFKAEISSIAGTAFSSILEAYWNFGYFGTIIYFLYGFIIGLLEFRLKQKSMFKFMYYLAIIPYIYEFHRSDFGHISFCVILISLMVYFIYFFYKYFYMKIKFINKIGDVVTNPGKIIIFAMNYGLFNWLSDEKYLKLRYKLFLNKKLNLDNPITYNEKIQWLKIHDRKDIYTKMVDKVDVKDYVSNLIGSEHIIPTLGVYNSFDDIDFSKLPNQFVIKCSHDSGGLFICRDKNKFDIDLARKKINSRMKKNYYYLSREWPYKNIKPRIIVEKFMEINNALDKSKKNMNIISAEKLQSENGLLDYKFMCFDGKVEYLLLDIGVIGKGVAHAEQYYRNVYDCNFKIQSFRETRLNYPIAVEKPKNFNEMLKIAETISKGLPHVRVDLYNVNGKIYFGEITFYHGSGLYNIFIPEEYDERLGSLINLKKYFRK